MYKSDRVFPSVVMLEALAADMAAIGSESVKVVHWSVSSVLRYLCYYVTMLTPTCSTGYVNKHVHFNGKIICIQNVYHNMRGCIFVKSLNLSNLDPHLEPQFHFIVIRPVSACKHYPYSSPMESHLSLYYNLYPIKSNFKKALKISQHKSTYVEM